MGGLSKPRRKKYCNYCKNHGIKVLEKGHRSCPYKNCKCKKCKDNYQKTLNAIKSRAKKAKNIVANSNRSLMISSTVKKGIHEYLAFKNNLEVASDPRTLMVYPYNFPHIKFFQKNIDGLNNLIDNQPSAATSSRYQYRKLENGAWKVVCLNQETRDHFMNLVKGIRIKLPNFESECPLFVIPENDKFKHISMSCILDNPINCVNFLRSVASSNRYDTSRWECDDSVAIDGGHKVNFVVDPLSYRYMLVDDLMICVNDQEIQAKLELNPFLAYMFEEVADS